MRVCVRASVSVCVRARVHTCVTVYVCVCAHVMHALHRGTSVFTRPIPMPRH